MTTLARRASAAALLGLVLVTGAVHAGHGPALGADDHGQYLLHAKALVEGRPYSDIGFIHTRYSTKVAPIAEPPGLPVLIAGVFSVAGEKTPAVRVILYLSFALLGLFVFRYLRTLADVGTAAVVTAWTLTALARAHVLDTMLADIPFCAALWGCFLLADSAPLRGTRRLVLLGILGAMAFAFRMAALPLLPAAATALVLRPREEKAGFLTLGIVWAVVAAAILLGLRSGEVLGSETLRTPGVFLNDVVFNLREMRTGARVGIPLSFANRALSILFHGVVLTIALIGALVGLRERYRRFAWITAVWYLVMLVLLPTGSSRYMWPLYPLLALSFVEGARWIVRAIAPRGRDAAPGLAAAVLLIVLGVAQDALAKTPPTYTRVAEIGAVREALAREAVGQERLRVLFFSPRVMSWEDGYVTMAPFAAPTSELLAVVRSSRITHVVIGDAGTGVLGLPELQTAVSERPSEFRDVLTNSLFRVVALRTYGATK
ncbi:MAG TPA: glycosyltransferase family 39 protein [Gemmatimonadaceae bacterium]